MGSSLSECFIMQCNHQLWAGFNGKISDSVKESGKNIPENQRGGSYERVLPNYQKNWDL